MAEIVRMISKDGAVVVTAADTTDIVRRMQECHDTAEVASAALGRLLTAASIMGYNLKNETDTLTLRVRGNGPLGQLIAVSDASGNVRGYVGHPEIQLPVNGKGKIDVSGGVGKGELYVIKDLGLKEPYSGCVPLVSGEIAEDITEYYAVSEQTPTVCALGVLVDRDLSIICSGGFILQLLPFTPDEVITAVEENVNKIGSITSMMQSGMSPEDIARELLSGMEPEILDRAPVGYKCKCSKERMLSGIASLPKEDIEDLAKDEEIEVVCQFCNKKYRFKKNELLRLLK